MGDTGLLISLLISLRSCAYEKNAEKAFETIPQVEAALSGFPQFRFLIADVLDEARALFRAQRFEQAYDLIDAIHCLPEVAFDENRNMGRFWRTHIAGYQEKYSSGFFDPYKMEILGL